MHGIGMVLFTPRPTASISGRAQNSARTGIGYNKRRMSVVPLLAWRVPDRYIYTPAVGVFLLGAGGSTLLVPIWFRRNLPGLTTNTDADPNEVGSNLT